MPDKDRRMPALPPMRSGIETTHVNEDGMIVVTVQEFIHDVQEEERQWLRKLVGSISRTQGRG